MTSWLDAQNSQDALLATAAADTLWCRVQRLRALEFAFVVALPVGAAIGAVLWPAMRVTAAYFGFLMSLFDVFLDHVISRLRSDAAKMQDRFDSIALKLPRVRLRAESDPDIARIGELARSQPAKRSHRNRNWYSPCLGALPLQLGRIACMRESVHWDCTIRKMWSWAVLVLPGSTMVVLLTRALVEHERIDDFFVSVLAPLTPALIWCLREWRDHTDGIATYEALREKLRRTWDSGTRGEISNETLNSIAGDLSWTFFIYRCDTPPVPDAVYRVLRAGQTISAAEAARLLIREFQERQP